MVASVLPAAAVAQQPRTDAAGDPLPAGAVARLGSVRFHLGGGVVAAAFAPDSKSLLVVGMDIGTKGRIGGLVLARWDAATGRELSQFVTQDYGFQHLAWLPDGKHVLLGGSVGAKLFDVATGKVVRAFDETSSLLACTASPDGGVLMTQPNVTEEAPPIQLWDVATGKRLSTLKAQGWVTAARFSKDGKQLLTWSVVPKITRDKGQLSISVGPECPRHLRVWDVATQKVLHEQLAAAGEVALASDAETAALTMVGGVNVIHLPTGKLVCKIPAEPLFVAFTPDGKSLVTANYMAPPVLWDAATGKEIRTFDAPSGERARLAGFSPDGKTLVLLTGRWNEDGSILLLDVATGKPLRQGVGHTDTVTCAAFAPSGKLLASGSTDRTVRLWDPAKGKELKRLDGHAESVGAVAFAPSGKLLASSSADGKTFLWDPATGKEVARLDGPPGGALALAFSADGKTLTAGGKTGVIQIWSVPAGKALRDFQVGQDGCVYALGPTGAVALSANGEVREELVVERIRLWSTGSAQVLFDLPLRAAKENFDHLTVWTAAVSPENRLLAAATSRVSETLRGTMYADHEVRIWEKTTGQEIRTLKGHRVHAVAFAPGNRLVALGHGNNYGFHNMKLDHDVSVWNVLTGEQHAMLQGHANQIACVVFSPDGKTLVSGSADHTLLVWEVPALRTDPGVVNGKQVEAWWDQLGGPAATAYPAMGQLVDHPNQAVAAFKERLKPAPAVDSKRIAELLKLLDSPTFKERQKATTALEEMGDVTEPALRKVLEDNPSLELRRRVELLLGKIESTSPPPETLRVWRALMALEMMRGHKAAGELLEALAAGAPEARQTREAAAILERLAVRKGS
jgi:WD40 repeat protein